MSQERLQELLKKKGIGPEGSKSLKHEELREVTDLFKNPEVSLITKATMLTALLTLSPNQDEKLWLEEVHKNPELFLPEMLIPFVKEIPAGPFLKLIKKIIYHTDLTEQECRESMAFFFREDIPDYLKGAFLEAERLKRESFTENKIFFETMWEKISHHEIPGSVLIDFCDSYDGSSRTRNFSLFTAALLASAGFPSIVHGLDKVAPKEGHTSHQILKLAGKNPLKAIMETAANIQNPEIAWGYLDQEIYFPELHKLKTMRKEMVKRPFLATFEKLLQPIKVRNGNFLVSGYTHPHYREELVKQLKEQGKCKNAIILKGTEGSTHLSMTRSTVCIHFDGKEISDDTIHPSDFNLQPLEEKIDKSITAEASLKEGLEALEGKINFARENILYLGLVILTKGGLMEKEEALKKLSTCLDSGKALMHWEKGSN